MKYIVYIVVIVIAGALEAVLFSELPVLNAAPSILLLITLFVAAKGAEYEYIFVALVAGFFSDIATGLPIGSHMLGFVLIASVINALFNWLITLKFDWKYVPAVALVSSAVLLFWFAFFGWASGSIVASGSVFGFGAAVNRLFPTLIVTALAMFPVYWFTEWLVGFLGAIELRKKGVGL